jgi:hypothetical protein
MRNGSSSTEGGPLACPRCAIHYPLEERFCTQCGMPLTYTGRSGEEPITEAHERARKIKPQYAQGEAVKAGWARNQSEAELMQGLLLEEGIPSFLKRSRGFDVPDFLAAGPRDILVPEAGLEAARELLAGVELTSEDEAVREITEQMSVRSGGGVMTPGRLFFWVIVAVLIALGIVYALYRVPLPG